MVETEGVTKYNPKIIKGKLLERPDIGALNSWRKVLYRHKLIGCDSKGKGYGNVSMLLQPYDAPPNKKRFVITGTQTGHLEDLTEEDYAIVTGYYPEQNSVEWQEGIKPSSEAMTHGAIYDLDERARFVFHVHSPEIWNSKILGIPYTRRDVKYGTPEMAKEVARIFEERDATNIKNLNIFLMGGHKDGVFSFGETATLTGCLILYYLSQARVSP